MSLYQMWLKAHNTSALPPEWELAHNFLTWATANKYKAEYGYEGDFTPDNLKNAIMKNSGNGKKESGEPDASDELPSAEALKNSMNKDALIELAKEKEVQISDTDTKQQIAEKIVAKADGAS